MNQVYATNKLLADLPRKNYLRLLPRLESVTLKFGDELHCPREAIRYVYFPIDCLVSLLTAVDGRPALEVGLVGCEGMVGISLALGVGDSPVSALVQGSGTAFRMKSTHFLTEFRHNLPLQRAVNRYIYDMLVQITQTAVCNRFHEVEARLARWLLMTRDRVGTTQFRLTQDMLAGMLGVLRVAVTKAARSLQKRNVINYRRGEISILDNKALEAAACPCYQIVKSKPSATRV
jgi:hypothetical protein